MTHIMQGVDRIEILDMTKMRFSKLRTFPKEIRIFTPFHPVPSSTHYPLKRDKHCILGLSGLLNDDRSVP